MSKREHLSNKEKCFLFHFESSFCSWDNQILTFQIFKCHDVIKYLSMKHETHFIEKLRKSLNTALTQPGNEIWPVHVTLENNFFIINFYGKCGRATSSRPFLIFKESFVKRNLRRSACWSGLISIVLLLHI